MVRITFAEKAPSARSSLVQHAIAPGIWWAVRNRVLNDVDVDPGSIARAKTFLRRPINDFFNSEIWTFGMLAVKQRCRNPDFVSDFELGLRRYPRRHAMYRNLVARKIQSRHLSPSFESNEFRSPGPSEANQPACTSLRSSLVVRVDFARRKPTGTT